MSALDCYIVNVSKKPTHHQQQEAIKRLNAGKETQGEIARSYNMSRWTIPGSQCFSHLDTLALVMTLEAFRICGGMIVNEKVAVTGGTWWQEQFAKARHMRFAEDISIINVPIDPEARIPIKNSLNVLRR